MKRRLISAVLTAAMAATLFTGCGNNGSEADQGTNAGGEQANQPGTTESTDGGTDSGGQASDGKVELTYWVNADGLNEYEQSFVDKYNETSELGYIKLVTKPEGDSGEVMAAMMAGTAPDILILSYGEAETYAYSGALLPLDEYLEGWDGYQDINQDMVENFYINDNHYALPAGEYAMSMLCNKEIFEENNIEIPESWTWEEFMEVCGQLRNEEEGQYGFALNYNTWGNWWFQMFVWAAGGDLTIANDDGTVTTSFSSDEVVKAAQFYRDLKNNGCIQYDLSLSLDELKQEFADGKVGIIYDGLDSLPGYASMGMDTENIAVVPIPKGPSGSNQTQLGGSCYVLHAGVPEEKRAAVFEYYTMVSNAEYYTGKADYFADQGTFLLTGQICNSMDMETILSDVPADIVEMSTNSSGNGRLSWYASTSLSTYVDDAVEKVMTDDSADIKETFAEYEEEANKTAVQEFNESVQGSK